MIEEVAAFLTRGHDLPSVSERRAKPGEDGRFDIRDILTPATSEILDTFRGVLGGRVSEEFARAFCSANPRGGNRCAGNQLIFEDGTAYRPTITRTRDRPAWTQLVREIWPERRGQRCLVMIVDNFKKRLWPYARVGVLGERTPVFLHDYRWHGVEAVEVVDWQRLLDCLSFVELVYSLGWSKYSIRDGLMLDLKNVQKHGIKESSGLESKLRSLRGTAEFRVALMIAQKEAGNV